MAHTRRLGLHGKDHYRYYTWHDTTNQLDTR